MAQILSTTEATESLGSSADATDGRYSRGSLPAAAHLRRVHSTGLNAVVGRCGHCTRRKRNASASRFADAARCPAFSSYSGSRRKATLTQTQHAFSLLCCEFATKTTIKRVLGSAPKSCLAARTHYSILQPPHVGRGLRREFARGYHTHDSRAFAFLTCSDKTQRLRRRTRTEFLPPPCGPAPAAPRVPPRGSFVKIARQACPEARASFPCSVPGFAAEGVDSSSLALWSRPVKAVVEVVVAAPLALPDGRTASESSRTSSWPNLKGRATSCGIFQGNRTYSKGGAVGLKL